MFVIVHHIGGGGLHNGQMVTEGLGFAIKDLFKCTARHLKLLE